jgi:hypothetical protein
MKLISSLGCKNFGAFLNNELVVFFKYSWIRASQYESVEITNNMQTCNRFY